jgi:multisubunit Na+/H+ antiporter MnhF subunit
MALLYVLEPAPDVVLVQIVVDILSLVILVLALHVFMVAVAVWRMWLGENVIDRLISVELVSTLFLTILVLISLILRESIYTGLLNSTTVAFGSLASIRCHAASLLAHNRPVSANNQ